MKPYKGRDETRELNRRDENRERKDEANEMKG